MSIDTRSRLRCEVRPLTTDEVFDELLPAAIALCGTLAGRGIEYQELPPLGLDVDGRSVTLSARNGAAYIETGLDDAGVIAELEGEALSNLVQDVQTTMGLAMTSRAKVTSGSLDDWIAWEPALRALLDGRAVHEAGDVEMFDRDGDPLDLTRSFGPDDDRDEIAHFIEQAGFLHLRGVFGEGEMAAVDADIESSLAEAVDGDDGYWWATNGSGETLPVRVLWFHERSETLRELLSDARLQWLAELTGDDHNGDDLGAEGLIKPLDIVNGLSDLPWHKDCGQGGHSYQCSGMTVGISVTGADRLSGALGVIPGSHRANTVPFMRDRKLDLQPIMLETRTGDVTVHCSDTLHRAHPPIEQPRKVVYSGFRLNPRDEDRFDAPSTETVRAARSALTDVRDRIEAADNSDNDRRFKADISGVKSH